jgi:hypothetical protein
MRALAFKVLLIVVAVSPRPAAAGDPIPRAAELFRLHGSADRSVLEGSELHELAARPDVRRWMREETLAILKRNPDSFYGLRDSFNILLADGGTHEEAKLIAEIARSSPRALLEIMDILFESAAFSLTPALEKLLPAFAESAAESLEGRPSWALWLASHRFPAAATSRALENAWKKAARRWSGEAPDSLALVEIQLKDAGGTPLGFPGWVPSFIEWNANGALIWPDGKLRFLSDVDPEAPGRFELRIAAFGFRESGRTQVRLQRGKRTSESITMGSRRSRLRGKITPPPRIPLAARLVERMPAGHAPAMFGSPSDIAGPVRPDGTFEVPFHSRGRYLVIFTLHGDLLYAQEAPAAPAQGDLELGEVAVPPQRELVSVPIELEWPRGVARGASFQATIDWKPADPDLPSGRTRCYRSGISRLAFEPVVRIGLARNLRPGDYTVAVRFSRERDQGEVEEYETPFTVADIKTPLRLRPRAKGDARPPSAEEPVASASVVALGYEFTPIPGPGREVHLLVGTPEGLELRTVRDGASGPPQLLYASKQRGGDKRCVAFDGLAAEDGSLHVFLQLEEDELRRSVWYGRVAPGKKAKVGWVTLMEANATPDDTFGMPMVLARPRGLLELYTPAERRNKDQEGFTLTTNRRLVAGGISGGRYRQQRIIPVDSGPFQALRPVQHIVAPERGKAHALFFERKDGRVTGLAWSGLERFAPVSAVRLPPEASTQKLEASAGPGGEVLLALPVRLPDPEEKPGSAYRLWLARGKIGEPLRETGTLPAELPSWDFSLVRSAAGEVYAVSRLAPAGDLTRQQIAIWALSQSLEAAPILAPWRLSSPSSAPRAISVEPGRLALVWSDRGSIYLEEFALPE